MAGKLTSEVDGVVAVFVEGSEHVLGEPRSVSVREEVSVDLLELVHTELSGGTVLQEAPVPLLEREEGLGTA